MSDTDDKAPVDPASVPLAGDELVAAQRAYDTRVAAVSGFPAPHYGDTAASDPPYKRHLNAYLDGSAGGTSGTTGTSTPETDKDPVAGNTPIPDVVPPEPAAKATAPTAPPAPPVT